MDNELKPILDIRNLSISFQGEGGRTTAVNRLSFCVMPGQTMALVGESGCGKSTTALSILGLLPSSSEVSGTIDFGGHNLVDLSPRDLRRVRGNEIAMIFQEPMTSLNPVHRIGRQISEAIRYHQRLSKGAARARALELLGLVKLPDPERRIDDYPHQLSGGQRQRVMIAMAIAGNPKLLIADEPTTALDATIQHEILELIDELRTKLNMAVLLITHDLPLVSRWCHDLVVMHHGEKMEQMKASQLFESTGHPYTMGLLGASIRLDQNTHYSTRALSEIRVAQNPQGVYDFSLHTPERRVGTTGPVEMESPLLEVRNLVVNYGPFRAVDDASLQIAKGETLGLVGESGSGKSTLSKTIMRLLSPGAGSILFQSEDITAIEGQRLRALRPNMQMIFQDPFSSLNPRHTIGTILDIPLRIHGVDNASERNARISEIVDRVGLPAATVHRYPHEFSGGQRQRVGIARALILKPKLIVCDEPVSALDVSVQAQILNLLVDLKDLYQVSLLFISHDLAVVGYISDRIVVMKNGKIVETGDRDQVINNPSDPYTKSLIGATGG